MILATEQIPRLCIGRPASLNNFRSVHFAVHHRRLSFAGFFICIEKGARENS
jgi:hypothetical protein